MMLSLWHLKGWKIKHIFIKPLERYNHSFLSVGALEMGGSTTTLLSECKKVCEMVKLNVTLIA